MGMTKRQLADWARQQKEDLDCEGVMELIVHIASSPLEPCEAFQELHPQLGWSKFAANTAVLKVVEVKTLPEGSFRSNSNRRVTQLLSEARAQSKGK
jgi:hypothetical protein